MRTILARDVRPGDMIDLENDIYADHGNHPEFEFEYAIVHEVDLETPTFCICIYFDGITVGFPLDHPLKLTP